jgi:hypothetical protein
MQWNQSEFNYIKNSIEPNFQNLCDTPILRKIFKDRNSALIPTLKDILDNFGP